MAHDHSHDGDGYYLEQICLIAMSGAFGAVCLTLYFWQTKMLYFMLGTQFHPYILLSGAALSILVVIRAVGLWGETSKQAAAEHDHDHGHHHDHDHGHHQHEHDHIHAHTHEHDHSHGHGDAGHDHSHQDHDHVHTHTHDHDHSHDHGHDHDHSHAWTPMKCVVLLAPIIFYLLGLPTALPSVGDTARLDMNKESTVISTLAVFGFSPLNQTALLGRAYVQEVPDNPEGASFKDMENAAKTERHRQYWQDKWVQVRGQFVPRSQSGRQFTLVRFSMQCCAADAIPLRVRMISSDPITKVKQGQWVKVVGKIDFRKNFADNSYAAVLLVPGQQWVTRTAPDLNPYDQP